MEYGVKGMLLYGDPIDFAKEGTVYSNSGKWWLPGAEYLVSVSSHSLKTREKYTN